MERILSPETAELVDEPVAGPARNFVGYGPTPPVVAWPGGARVAVSLVVNYEEGSEYSLAAGDAQQERHGEFPAVVPESVRDLRTESVYEYGSRAGIWRLFRLFDESNVKATIFAAAVALERNPAVAAAIRKAGHEPCSHGWRWSEHWTFDREDEKRRMLAAIASIERSCGERPRGWNCRNSSSVNTRELLVEVGGFAYDSDAYNDDLPYYVDVKGQPLLILPYSIVYNDIRYARPEGFSSGRDFFEECRAAFDYLWEEGSVCPRMMSIGLHPRHSGQPSRAAALRDFIEYATRRGAWFARRLDIAEHWLKEFPPGTPNV